MNASVVGYSAVPSTSCDGLDTPDDLCDFVHFISNDLSSSGLPTMAAQFCESFSQECLPSQYLVRRATIEPNLHTLYLAFTDCLEH